MQIKGQRVGSVCFSPNGKYFAVSVDSHINIWKTPAMHKQFAPFVMYRDIIKQHYDDIVTLQWSADSKFLLSGSKDNTIRINLIELNSSINTNNDSFISVTLLGQPHPIVAAFWDEDPTILYCVDSKFIVTRKWEGGEINNITQGKWVITNKHEIIPEHSIIRIMTCDFHIANKLLLVALSDGVFSLYELPDCNNIQSLSVSQSKIDSVCINNSGEWLALGSSHFGQLLVWEWQSETYVLKQQGHNLDMSTICYSPDGQLIASGGDDGKLKLWNTTNGFCFVTFNEHTAPVTDITWTTLSNAVISSSLDGTVRAFDVIRYKNFRTMTPPTPTPLQCVSVDPSGEIVCAASNDTFDIYVWNLQTGKLLDIINGHEGPVSGIMFSPTQPILVSVSWDKTIRIWDVFESKPVRETMNLSTEIIGITFRGDGNQFCTWTLDAQIAIWEPTSGTLLGTIEGRKDLVGGGYSTQEIAKSNELAGKYFTSVCYTIDGNCIIAGGTSRFICIYEVNQKLLIRKISATNNRTYDGIMTYSKLQQTEAGSIYLIEDPLEDDVDKTIEYIPAAKRSESIKRNAHPTFRVRNIKMSPTGRAWSSATTEGLLIYSLDDTLLFDPFELDIDITPQNIEATLQSKNYLKALVMSFRLNEQSIIQKVVESIPHTEVPFVVRGFPYKYLNKLLGFLSSYLSDSQHLEFNLLWCLQLFNYHGRFLKDNSKSFIGIFRNLQKNITKQYNELSNICDDNTYTLDYLSSISKLSENSSNSIETL